MNMTKGDDKKRPQMILLIEWLPFLVREVYNSGTENMAYELPHDAQLIPAEISVALADSS